MLTLGQPVAAPAGARACGPAPDGMALLRHSFASNLVMRSAPLKTCKNCSARHDRDDVLYSHLIPVRDAMRSKLLDFRDGAKLL